jgi:plasmid stabilization system protein ParE
MSVVYTLTFQRQIAAAYEYGSGRFGPATAGRTYRRTIAHIENTVQIYPRTGRWLPEIKCYQSWVPRTPFVIFYRASGEDVEVLALFNGAQDLSGYSPGD